MATKSKSRIAIALSSAPWACEYGELEEAHGEAMLELRARKKLQSLRGEDDK
jgi:hypothetical protein